MPQEDFSAELLQIYYDRLFPYQQMTQWLSYDGGEEFLFRRELSYTLENDTYIRYKAFHNAEELKTSMSKTLPFKIDIGAVFSVSPADKGKVSAADFTPEQRELVFDIDLTDYDDIRTCCEGAAICSRCWQFMVAAVEVLNAALREDFGFENLLWVYSGRRGIHCWVADEQARRLENEARSAVVGYLSLVEGNENSARKVKLREPLHPSLDRAYRLLEPMFEDVILSEKGQGIFCSEKHWLKLLAMVPDEDIRANMTRRWGATNCNTSASDKWRELRDAVDKQVLKNANAVRSGSSLKRPAPNSDANKRFAAAELRTSLQEIVLAYLYPRLDANVSKQRNHLLKSPFAVHPKTGRVCVPIDATNMEAFDPFKAPTLGQLHEELDSDKGVTSMNKYVDFFESSFLKPLALAAKRKEREVRESDAAMTGDW
ncbi:DNA primase small subunit [Phytophthora fragariae]|uniref:DNA primase n=1 Tax=Phytophthora fragariae TaxID=53985 RepID=A0A6A4BXW9_9STRA|nr:DNA primase small subunit [Phytophthora fragariae]KAE8943957.1 DNA primase small subunit [Phytophthora fragariae]KAE9021291.1 DNA primase small subunit [Phytophthora fragariae]KAE9096158.1 DNA primase small subunit [Phytophthora fragariae]KAE9126458.1 DNA primase small subunit [Phytophthora fragariae]